MNENRPNYIKKTIYGLDEPFEQRNGRLKRKHRTMAESPWQFLRGSTELFYEDLANAKPTGSQPSSLHKQTTTTVVGDCHLGNFGFFTEESAYGDNVIFACNDFDDACIGFPSWDIVRFITSLHVAFGSQNPTQEQTAVAKATIKEAGQAFIHTYSETLNKIIVHPKYRNTSIGRHNTHHLFQKLFKKTKAQSAAGKQFLSKSSLAKAVDLTQQKIRFKNKKKFKRLNNKHYSDIKNTCQRYVNDSIVDIVQRINAGTGSLDLERYYLLVGPDTPKSKQDLGLYYIVEMKQQRRPSPLQYFPDLNPINQQSAAELHVYCQRLMQRYPDIILNHFFWKDREWLLRSRHHARTSIKPEAINGTEKPEKLIEYAKMCGKALALAHSRGDRRSSAFERQMARYVTKYKTLLEKSAIQHAQQCISDWAIFSEIYKH
ncbi:MAG: DUF2252 family protein [Cellvibrionaceae bacterium]